MASDSRAHGTESADHLGSSEARQFLSRLSGAFGKDGVLMVQRTNPDPEGADLAPKLHRIQRSKHRHPRRPTAECASVTAQSGVPTAAGSLAVSPAITRSRSPARSVPGGAGTEQVVT